METVSWNTKDHREETKTPTCAKQRNSRDNLCCGSPTIPTPTGYQQDLCVEFRIEISTFKSEFRILETTVCCSQSNLLVIPVIQFFSFGLRKSSNFTEVTATCWFQSSCTATRSATRSYPSWVLNLLALISQYFCVIQRSLFILYNILSFPV